MKTISLSKDEMRNLIAHKEIVKLVVPNEQPPKRYTSYTIDVLETVVQVIPNLMSYRPGFKNDIGNFVIPLRYPSGGYEVKETGAYVCTKLFKRRPPITTTQEAVRYYVDVKTSFKRVLEITTQEWTKVGINTFGLSVDDYREAGLKWFNTKFAKPRKQGDGYVCYPYSLGGININDPVWEYIDDGNFKPAKFNYKYNVVDGYEYKGLPLTIHANPYLEVLKVGCER